MLSGRVIVMRDAGEAAAPAFTEHRAPVRVQGVERPQQQGTVVARQVTAVEGAVGFVDGVEECVDRRVERRQTAMVDVPGGARAAPDESPHRPNESPRVSSRPA